MSRSALDTPMMRQFLAIKARCPDAILFYRMGDFYEMFLADTERAALDHNPDDLEARSTLGRVLITAHRDPEAIKEYGELIELLDRRGSLLPSEALE